MKTIPAVTFLVIQLFVASSSSNSQTQYCGLPDGFRAEADYRMPGISPDWVHWAFWIQNGVGYWKVGADNTNLVTFTISNCNGTPSTGQVTLYFKSWTSADQPTYQALAGIPESVRGFSLAFDGGGLVSLGILAKFAARTNQVYEVRNLRVSPLYSGGQEAASAAVGAPRGATNTGDGPVVPGGATEVDFTKPTSERPTSSTAGGAKEVDFHKLSDDKPNESTTSEIMTLPEIDIAKMIDDQKGFFLTADLSSQALKADPNDLPSGMIRDFAAEQMDQESNQSGSQSVLGTPLEESGSRSDWGGDELETAKNEIAKIMPDEESKENLDAIKKVDAGSGALLFRTLDETTELRTDDPGSDEQLVKDLLDSDSQTAFTAQLRIVDSPLRKPLNTVEAWRDNLEKAYNSIQDHVSKILNGTDRVLRPYAIKFQHQMNQLFGVQERGQE